MKKVKILTFSCPDQSGIQAKVTGLMDKYNAFLTDVQSYSDKDTNRFFSRIVFYIDDVEIATAEFFSEFKNLAMKLSMQWSIDDESKKIRTVIAVSKEGHCLNDLLYRAKYRDMPIEIVGVVSNHEVYREIVEFSGIKFHHLPIEKSSESKKMQENEFKSIVASSGIKKMKIKAKKYQENKKDKKN